MVRVGNRGFSVTALVHMAARDSDEPSEGFKRAVAARERLLGGEHPAECACARCAVERTVAMVDKVVGGSHAHAIHQLGQQLEPMADEGTVYLGQAPRHVDGCRCTDCEVVREHIGHIELTERELCCELCRRVFARVRAPAMATIEVICEGCEREGRKS